MTYQQIIDNKLVHDASGLKHPEDWDWQIPAGITNVYYPVERTRFPNGFTSWAETHHEMVEFMTTTLLDKDGDNVVHDHYNSTGIGGIYELAIAWTNEFEEANKGTEWGIEIQFYDTIESFLDNKSKQPAHDEQSNG